MSNNGSALRAATRRPLPQPTRTRYQPLRAGICNIWEYDNQEFWFCDGRLILRGGNEAGKSKALEVLLPFLLDADLRPHRLDPFGEKAKTMHWNLVGFDPERASSIGYTWIEFGRLDPEEGPQFCTLCAGFRATRSVSSVQSWYTVTSLRVGEGFELLDGQTPLTREQLRQLLGERGSVHDIARDYRAAVNRELFHLGTERYAALVHLLLQLRRPHLSDKLNPAALSQVLSESLPPLDEGKITVLAQAFDRLDSEAAELAELEGSHAAVAKFREAYKLYARHQARRRAQGLRDVAARCDELRRKVDQAAAAKEAALREIERIEGERGRLGADKATLEGELQALDASEAMNAAARLRDMKAAAEADRRAAEGARERVSDAEADLEAVQAEVVAATEQEGESRERLGRAKARALQAAREAGLLLHHEAQADLWRDRPEEAREALDHAAAEQIARFGELSTLRHKVQRAEANLAAARRRVDEATDRRDQLSTQVAEDERSCLQLEEALGQGVVAWLQALDAVQVDADRAERLAEDAVARALSNEATAGAVREVIAPHAAAADAELGEVLAALRLAEARAAELRSERDRISSMRHDAPPPRPGRGDRSARRGAPLWQVTEFGDGVAAGARAALEAALEAAGLLDAWVSDEGDLLVPNTLDTVLWARPTRCEHSLADVLHPVPGAAASTEAVARALESVGLIGDGDSPADEAWVATDGRWQLGPLRGRWSKAEAEHIGAGARDATRRRRLEAIDAQLAAVSGELGELAARRGALEERKARLAQALASFPDGSALVKARAGLEAAGRSLAQARRELVRESEQMSEAGKQLRAAERQFRDAAKGLGLAGDIEDVGAAVSRVEAYRRALADFAHATAAHLRAAELGAAARARGEGLRRRIEGQRRLAEAAAHAAQKSAAQASSYEELTGSDVVDVIARRDGILAQLGALTGQLAHLTDELTEAQRALVRAEVELARSDEDLKQREAERGDVMERVAQLADTEILALVVPEEPLAERPWALAAALDLVRRIHAATGKMSVDDKSMDRVENKTYEAFLTLRKELSGDFDPNASRDHGLLVVTIKQGSSIHGVNQVERTLSTEIAQRKHLLEKDERELIEQHLVGEVGLHLQERVVTARRLVANMNEQLAQHPTNSGITVRLKWAPRRDTEAGAEVALEILRKDVRLLRQDQQAALVQFLRARISEARESDDTGSSAERMARALDYRTWHEFTILTIQDGHERILSRKVYGTGSGGSKAVLIHLPLFAAAAAHYQTARPEAPHLVMLDEAFAGIDATQRGSCMGLLVKFDLDFLLTNHSEWGCYAELPGVATYHLARDPSRPGVAAVRFVWNGTTRFEDDPFLRSEAAAQTA